MLVSGQMSSLVSKHPAAEADGPTREASPDAPTGARGTAGSDAAGHPVTEATRRTLSSRQQATLAKLIDATVEELRSEGFDGLSVRAVAARAGVAPATAYNYFSSREHLVTEVFWRRLTELDHGDLTDSDSTADRVARTLEGFALLVADEPELAAACTVAMLSTEQDVKLLRDRIGTEMNRRLRDALGVGSDPEVLGVLEFVVSGAMLQAGMGHMSYIDLAERFRIAVRLVLRD